MSVFDTLLRKCRTHFVPKGWALWKPLRWPALPAACRLSPTRRKKALRELPWMSLSDPETSCIGGQASSNNWC